LSSERLKEMQGLGAPLSSPHHAERGGTVRVVHGIHALSVGVAGKTVSEAREVLRQALNISPRAIALVDGQEVDESQTLLPGQHLEFVRVAGEKG
jgi:RNase P/RNase MRP subunit p29